LATKPGKPERKINLFKGTASNKQLNCCRHWIVAIEMGWTMIPATGKMKAGPRMVKQSSKQNPC